MRTARTFARGASVATAVAGLLLPITTTAHADETDIGGAALTYALDVAAAEAQNAANELQDPNTTCNIVVTGDNVVQRVNALVAEVHAEDVIAADGTCVSFSTGTYTAHVSAVDEVYTPSSLTNGSWGASCAAPGAGANSIEGVANAVTYKLCTFPFPSSALGRYHRAKAVLTNSRGQTFTKYSPIWYVSN
jgi:hypothetical protein